MTGSYCLLQRNLLSNSGKKNGQKVTEHNVFRKLCGCWELWGLATAGQGLVPGQSEFWVLGTSLETVPEQDISLWLGDRIWAFKGKQAAPIYLGRDFLPASSEPRCSAQTELHCAVTRAQPWQIGKAHGPKEIAHVLVLYLNCNQAVRAGYQTKQWQNMYFSLVAIK